MSAQQNKVTQEQLLQELTARLAKDAAGQQPKVTNESAGCGKECARWYNI